MLTDALVLPQVLFVNQFVAMSIARAQTSGDSAALDKLSQVIKADRHLTLNQIYRLMKPQTAVIRRIFAGIPAAIMDKSPAQIEDMYDPQLHSQVRTLSDIGSDAALGFPADVFRVLRVMVPTYQSHGSPPMPTLSPLSPISPQPLASSTPMTGVVSPKPIKGVLRRVSPIVPANQPQGPQGSPPMPTLSPLLSTYQPLTGTIRRVAPIVQTAVARWPPKGVIRGKINLGTTASATPTVGVNPHMPRRLRYRLPPKALTKGAVRRLARRGGVKRISDGVYTDARAALQLFLRNVIYSAVQYTENANRKTVTVQDVILGLKRNGQTLYL